MRTRSQRHHPRPRGDAVTRAVLAASVALTLLVTVSFLFGVSSGGRSTVRAADAAHAKADAPRVTTTQVPTGELTGR